jgi:hypothetical protein
MGLQKNATLAIASLSLRLRAANRFLASAGMCRVLQVFLALLRSEAMAPEPPLWKSAVDSNRVY